MIRPEVGDLAPESVHFVSNKSPLRRRREPFPSVDGIITSIDLDAPIDLRFLLKQYQRALLGDPVC